MGTARGTRPLIAIGLAVMASLGWTRPALAEQAEFISGKGQATARVWRFNTQWGSVDIPLGIGKTRAGYLENNAYASAEAVDYGVLRLPNTVKICSTDDFPVPEPTEANSSAKGGKPDVHAQTLSGSEGAGYESAAAYPGSRGTARTTGTELAIPGVIEIEGGTAFSEARMNPKRHTRTATGVSNIGSIRLLGGLVELKGLRWTMTLEATGIDSRTRKITKKDFRFTFGDAILAGQALPTGTDVQRRTAIDAINRVVNPLGVVITLPELRKLSPTSFELTELFVGIGGNPIYGTAMYDLLANTDNDYSLINVYDQASRGLFDATDCNQLGGAMKQVQEVNVLYNTTGLVVPIIVSAFGSAITGGSRMGFEFGKTTVQLDDTYYPPPAPLLDLPSVLDIPGVAPAAVPATPSVALPPPAAPTLLARPASGAVSNVKGSRACRTTSPAGRPRCWDGASALAAGGALAAVLGLFVADEAWRRRRRSSRLKGAATA